MLGHQQTCQSKERNVFYKPCWLATARYKWQDQVSKAVQPGRQPSLPSSVDRWGSVTDDGMQAGLPALSRERRKHAVDVVTQALVLSRALDFIVLECRPITGSCQAPVCVACSLQSKHQCFLDMRKCSATSQASPTAWSRPAHDCLLRERPESNACV